MQAVTDIVLLMFGVLALGFPVARLGAFDQSATSGLALFALGASMARYRIAGGLSEPILLVFLKTAVHPALVWLLATWLFDLPALWAAVAVTMAASPTGVNTYLFAQRYDACVATSATTILLSTALSALSLSALMTWLAGS